MQPYASNLGQDFLLKLIKYFSITRIITKSSNRYANRHFLFDLNYMKY